MITQQFVELTEMLRKSWSEMSPVARALNMGELKKTSNLSERELAKCFGVSKSEIHRMISVSKLSKAMLDKAKIHGTDYHTLCVYAESPESARKEQLWGEIVNGSIKKHKAAKEFLGDALRRNKKPIKKCHECKRKIA